MLCAFSAGAQADFNFVHPGILTSEVQLRYVRDHKHLEPWATSMHAALASPLADRNYRARPWSIVHCGAYSVPDYGCSDEIRDAQAAYLQALLWRYTGDPAYAENVREIFKAWTETLEQHTGNNRRLQASWAAQLFTRAAEIVKYSYGGWPQVEKDAVTRMFREQYRPYASQMFLPSTGNDFKNNSNWQASAVEALVNIAIFTKDEQGFHEALSKWKSLLGSYIYLPWDGARPLDAVWFGRSYNEVMQKWGNPTRLISGMPMEFCRDLPHSGYGVAALINVAETARIQGVDLYQEYATRLTQGMETLSRYSLDLYEQNSDYPQICGKRVDGWPRGTLFIGYNQYAMRLGMSLPYTLEFIEKHPTFAGHVHYQWERLTHYGVP
ncbi:hypothetical protein NS96R_01700 [Pseudomonas parafulva]|uniref:Alginate lyase domain-containing protein n=1 Tax=Pseudomonas parafulva TaxID=157782 RepID=A0AAJ0LNB0_9PSED|nr:hypothetical protein NS96R_01700 [Pseudomonas parafulva]